nr:serine/threonine protein kinase [Pyrinomonadaceae bacterium]
MTASIGAKLGRYKIHSAIGAGGMGEVFLAEDTRLGRKVALKILPHQFTVNEDRLHRFEQEAIAISALNHPNIITIYEIGESDGTNYIAVEFIDGKTLRESISERSLSLSNALNIAVQVAEALSAAHRAGIIHRDIKPENIMIRPDGYVKVLDFGLAKLTEKRNSDLDGAARKLAETNPGVLMGTMKYLSPEQARGKDVDTRSDIFSFGIVLYEMIAGRVPFDGESMPDVWAAILNREPASIRGLMPEVSLEVEEIIDKTLRKNRDERYQTAEDLLFDLKATQKRLEFEAEFKRNFSAGKQTSKKTSEKTGKKTSETVNSTAPSNSASLTTPTIRITETDNPFPTLNSETIPLPPVAPNNLTEDFTPIVGREKEIAEIKNLLSQTDVRLLTLTGIGGTGKTTLSKAAARELL